MDHVFIIKIQVTFTLDIKTPTATWILARLYDEEIPISRKNLMKNLCQASFDSMVGENDFGNTMKQLTDAKYIEQINQSYTDLVTSPSLLAGVGGSQQVTREREGYVITELGIYAFRKQIATPLEKIKANIDKVPSMSRFEKFKNIIATLKANSNLISLGVKLCVENAPLVIDFIKTMHAELVQLGIPILI